MCNVRIPVHSNPRRRPVLFQRLSPEKLPVTVCFICNAADLPPAKMRIKITVNKAISGKELNIMFENLTPAQQAAMRKDGSHVAASARRAEVIRTNREQQHEARRAPAPTGNAKVVIENRRAR
jgi:hypothetical protein